MAVEENVLCFKRTLLDELGPFQGLSLDVERYLPLIKDWANLTYRVRSEAETNLDYKQLIPYVLIMCNNKILRYQRGKGGGENRLHGLYSIGVGGHIDDTDYDMFSTDDAGYQEGMMREVQEEVEVKIESESMVAVINDDNTEVGKVHFGIVHIMHVSNEDVIGHRSGIKAPEFVDISTIQENPDNYESWSQLCLEQLNVLLPKHQTQV